MNIPACQFRSSGREDNVTFCIKKKSVDSLDITAKFLIFRNTDCTSVCSYEPFIV